MLVCRQESGHGSKSQLRALFINPPDIFSKVFPLGFSQIVSVARSAGLHVGLLDLNNLASDEALRQSVVKTILDFEPDMLCLTGFSNNVPFISAVTTSVRETAPKTLIVGGGYWCRWSPDFALRNTACDLIINGEGDVPFSEICELLPDRDAIWNVEGISFLRDGEVFSGGAPREITALDTLPDPEWELFDYGQRYVWREGEMICCSLQTGRGCIGRCMFCTGSEQRFRKYSAQRIISEMRLVRDTYGVTSVRFKEALTLIDNRWSREFLHAVIEADLGMTFEVICRVDSISDDLVGLLKQAGCYSIQFGIEVADDFMLKSVMHKNTTVAQVKQALKLCHRASILPSGGFIVGLPGERISTLLKTVAFALTNRVAATGVTFPMPFPGTELYDYTKETLGLTDEQILLDDRMIGYSTFSSGWRRQLWYLDKFKVCSLPAPVLVAFRELIARLLGINDSILRRGYVGTLAAAGRSVSRRIYRRARANSNPSKD